MKQKLIFLDIDGTLLPPGEMLIPQSTVEALHKAHANGHWTMALTARYAAPAVMCSAGIRCW